MIYIYKDYAFGNNVLFKRLSDDFGPENVGWCDAADIVSGRLNPEKDLLVMPGGAGSKFCEQLSGDGNRAIKEFVARGGTYMGICAGAYYACSRVSWAAQTPVEISSSMELAFFDCTASGPVYEFIEDGDPGKFWHQAVKMDYEHGSVTVLYHGGPVFVGVPEDQVLARYSDLPGEPPAVVGRTYGKGRVILSSPHLEYDGSALSQSMHPNKLSHPWHQAVENKLRGSENEQSKAWNWLIESVWPRNREPRQDRTVEREICQRTEAGRYLLLQK